jgi:serine/threonine protein kinase, bacterial
VSGRNMAGMSWAVVTLAAAVISSPLLLHLYTGRSVSATAPAVPQSPVKIELKLPESFRPESPRKADAPAENALLEQPAADPQSSASPVVGSQRYLTVDDLSRLSRWELDVLRNTIYARHGRRFHRADLQAYFDQQPWYRPVYAPDAFPEGILSSVERYNSKLIASYQESH